MNPNAQEILICKQQEPQASAYEFLIYFEYAYSVKSEVLSSPPA